MGHSFRELGFGTISRRAGITAITELAVKSGLTNRSPYLEIIADNLSKASSSWGCVSALDLQGRTIWIVDAHRDDGKRYVVRANEKLTAFVELEAATRRSGRFTRPVTLRVSDVR